ncbi:MAG: nucleotide sugar dehydrogenase [Phycisphaeraceae bacterium]|nr:nucleotide sugar dehydrogenase [Phycisphaeraceae bacterium]
MPTLLERINNRTCVVGVIGLGYVGLPLAKAFHDVGMPVIGFDVDPAKIRDLKEGVNYLLHFGPDYCKGMAKSGKFTPTADFKKLGECDAIIVCVPTPLGKHMDPDLSYVVKTTELIAATLRPGQLVVLESTSYPRTTRDDMLPVLERTGLKCGSDEGFYLAFSPEREDPGRKDHNTTTIPKLVGGIERASGEVAAALYRHAIKTVVPVSSAEVAEAAKILENTFRAVNIAMVNELKMLFTAMGIDVWEVIQAASTKPFGFMPFYPGPGLGGHCIPIDPFYLTWKAREYNMPTRFIELAGQINHMMPDYVVGRVGHALNERGKSVRGSRVLILGLAYKADIDDVRESPSFELIEKLDELGAHVDYNDPHVAKTKRMRRYDLHMESVALTPENLGSYDCVLVSTNHSAYDWAFIAKHSKMVVDTRNAMRGVPDRSNVVMA